MHKNQDLSEIREKERLSHILQYSSHQHDSWMKKPVKTVTELFPYFTQHQILRVLDLGCGAGRNGIAIAQEFCNIQCHIDCVDILDVAIEKLLENAVQSNVTDAIHPFLMPMDDYPITPNSYDWILAVSALEHMDCEDSFYQKLIQIRDGLCKGGVVCLIVNTEVTEVRMDTGLHVPAQFEVNLSSQDLLSYLACTFSGWNLIKSGVKLQRYQVPRDGFISDLRTKVVTFAAKK